jgi:predicted DCC family thiol-disulfide oxidoreductase YuxK
VTSTPARTDYGSLPSAVPGTATLVFDGHCGFCTRSVGWLRKLDRHNRVEVRAGQTAGTRDLTGLTEQQTDAAAWTVTPEGVAVGGARAVALYTAVAWNSKLPLLPWKVPGVPWLLDRLYELIARNRHRLPGMSPWCSEHDGECDPA